MGWVSADVPGCGLFDTGVLLLLLFTAAAAEAALAAAGRRRRCGGHDGYNLFLELERISFSF